MSDSLSSGETSEFLAGSSKQCHNCKILAANVEAAYRNGGYIKGGRWTVQSVAFTRKAPLGMIWKVDLSTARERWYDSKDQLVKVVSADVLRVGLALIPRDGDWQVRELRLEES
ncbi:hypothetical protein ACT8ZV_00355 [Nocardioides sp. MAHUQ-72]|uniref:hypothetical protein n=1 Tax=unclassified Nocardioides TaxID=2615069 RepID=UPI003624272E